MTRTLAALTLAGCVLAGLLASHAPAQNPDLAQRLAKLETNQSELDRRLATLSAELTANAEALAALQAYAQRQAAAARRMQATLDASEQAGFTFGINPESRHLLLAGWRARLAAELEAVPGETTAKPAEPAGTAARSRR